MPNTFNADGRPDAMTPQDQLAYLQATGGTIQGTQPNVQTPIPTNGVTAGTINPGAAQAYESRISLEDAARKLQATAPKQRKTSFGLPMTGT